MLRRVGRFYSSLNLQARPLSKGLILPVDLSSETQSIPGLPDATVEKLKINNKPLKPGQSRTLYQEIEGYDAVTVLNLRQKPPKKPTYNNFNESNEFVRNSIAKAIQDIKTSNVEEIQIFQPEFKISNLSDNFYNLAAEAGFLTTHSYKASDRKKFPNFDSGFAACSGTGLKGKIYAESQNLARDLMETPANLMTPEIFAQTIQQKAVEWELDNVEIIVRDQAWIQEMKMGSFLSVSQGSEIPPVLLEIHVNKSNSQQENPKITFVGKGVTFDTGGISIKPSAGMDAMRGDMGGAATTAAAMLGAARLAKHDLGIASDQYLCCLTPLCENMPSGRATKPGDVVTAMNGKTIQVDNTDAEGRLILADALTYADKNLKSGEIIDAATLTGAMMIALGSGASGCFSRSDSMFANLEISGQETGDRMWRMPLFQLYNEKITKSPTADLNNIGPGRGGGACTAAAFLGEFVENENWCHVDIAGVMDSSDCSYVGKGMSGRPTRTFLKYLEKKLA